MTEQIIEIPNGYLMTSNIAKYNTVYFFDKNAKLIYKQRYKDVSINVGTMMQIKVFDRVLTEAEIEKFTGNRKRRMFRGDS